jgi:hypothetical protein
VGFEYCHCSRKGVSFHGLREGLVLHHHFHGHCPCHHHHHHLPWDERVPARVGYVGGHWGPANEAVHSDDHGLVGEVGDHMIPIRGGWRLPTTTATMRPIPTTTAVIRVRRFPVSLLKLFTHAIEGVSSFEPYTLIVDGRVAILQQLAVAHALEIHSFVP